MPRLPPRAASALVIASPHALHALIQLLATVLVVDDDPSLRDMVARFLEDEGYPSGPRPHRRSPVVFFS